MAGPWVWSERIDTLWIAGGASLLFGAVAVPASYLWAGFGPVVVATFLHLGVVVNYPQNIWLPDAKEPWLGELFAIWVPVAVPFFHCAQYLGVAADRACSEQPLRPVLWMSSLVALGLLLFEATVWGLPRITSITASQAVLIVTSILNIHHFVIDAVIWKRPQRAVAA